MYSALEDIRLLEEDWTDIHAMIFSLDADNSFIYPKTHHMLDIALVAVKNDPDTPNLAEALSGENEPHFRKIMSNEVKALNAQKARKTWTLIYKKHLPKNAKIIPTTWAMKIKSFPGGAFRSFK
eukprot:288919-Ditylum_brightwellii.AAC.1